MNDADHIKGQLPDAIADDDAHDLERGGDALSWDDAMRFCLEVVAQFRATLASEPFAFEPIKLDGRVPYLVDLPTAFCADGASLVERVLH